MQTKWLDALWLKMSALYPAWNSMVGLHPYILNEQGNPTSQLNSKGQAWSEELAELTGDELKIGFNNLKNRIEKNYPPSVFEFKELCTGNELDDVMNEIITRLQQGDSYEFENQLAFNLWVSYSFDLLNMKMYDVPKLIKQNINIIDKSSMMPLPDYRNRSIESKHSKENSKSRKQRQSFQSIMFSVISMIDDNLFNNKKIENLFLKQKTEALMTEFSNRNYIMPDMPEKFNILKVDSKAKFRNYLKECNKAMRLFLQEMKLI